MTSATTENKSQVKTKHKVLNVILKVLMWIGIFIVFAFALVALYRIINVLFVGAILFIAWLFPKR